MAELTKNEMLRIVEESISRLKNKDFNLYFFVIDTKGNPTSTLEYIYQTAYVLKEKGYNVTLLHSQMIVKSSVLSKKEKQNFLNLLWKVNYSLSDILRFKHKAKYALCYWGMSCLPISIKYSLIKGI